MAADIGRNTRGRGSARLLLVRGGGEGPLKHGDGFGRDRKAGSDIDGEGVGV